MLNPITSVDVPKDANVSKTSSNVVAPKTRENVPKSNPKVASDVSNPITSR